MKNVIYLLVKFGIHFLFIGLEVICFYLIIKYNQTQKEIFINSTNVFATKINTRADRLEEYLRLEEVNDSLQIQNATLIKKFINSNLINLSTEDSIEIEGQQYQLIPSKICNSTFHLKNNFITLCNGRLSGVHKDMGVISPNGIVGQVTQVSDNYAKVMSILHSQSRISATIKRTNAYGNLRWDGESPLKMSLEAIPTHIDVLPGDTVITSGFSTIFPKGIQIGVIEKASKRNSDYEITVRLFNDPSKWDVMYVVQNLLAEEQKILESSDNL